MADEQQLPYQNASPVDQANGQQNIQVNIDYLKTTRVHICMPCYGGQLTESTFMSYIKWANVARQLGLDWTVETMTNESLISRARNTLTAKFLHTKESTHLMFIDADIGWEPWHLLVMLNHDKDVVGGLYPMKSLPVKWCVNGIPDADQNDPSGLIEVTKTGTGFLLMKRHVFEKLNAHPAVKPFINDIGLDPALNPNMKTYFDTAVRENRYYSEDWTFCENWRDIGGQVWVDKRVLLKHTGTYVFDYQTQDKLYADLHEIALANQATQASQPALANQPQLANPTQLAAAPVDPTEPVAVEATVIATNNATEETATAD
jgi:hypothetical protein